ncbi:hypothetical protein B0O99DRAFT_735571 [Bisporella sp. PMI_857]|nr:hypothetical protein B0O99DRAFT_735571 [Bisporella sp. PMI_857]
MATSNEDIDAMESQETTPKTFEFVTNDNWSKSQIRSHAMKESWRQRGRANAHRSKGREIRPNEGQHRRGAQTIGHPAGREESHGSSGEDWAYSDTHESEEESETHEFPKEGVFLDLRHTLRFPHAQRGSKRRKWEFRPVPTLFERHISPYQSIGNAELDPFNNVKLSREDHELLHHWVKIYAYQAFGQPTDPIFDQIKDLYAPVNLSHVASVHGVLAHSACHLAYLRQDRSLSVQGITHKMAAIHLVNQALNEPMKAVSDETFSAVIKLLSFERYWGIENAWTLHRRGLAQMIKKRGGLSTFPNNWRLELSIQLMSLAPKPRWINPAFGTQVSGTIDNAQEPSSLHSEFLNFFDGIRISNEDILQDYPAIMKAVVFLSSSGNDDSTQQLRTKCLFYIAIILKESSRAHYSVSSLNKSLELTEYVWNNSVTSLRWLLLQGMGRGPNQSENLRRSTKLGEIALLLKEYPWRRMEDRLLSILLGRTLDGTPLYG